MIERFLCDRIGLSYESLGRRNVEKAVSALMLKYGFSCEDEYLELVRKSTGHFDELVHSMLIPETWFFRYGESFAFLSRHAKEHLAPLGRPVHALSIPCSSGEEPYSIAMTLLDSGVPPFLIHVDAADASGAAIDSAREGSYGPNSFRGGIPESMRRYFDVKGERHEVSSQVKELVKFRRNSIFDHDFTKGRPVYDLVFCRNMLIYFSPEKQAESLSILSGLLSEGGMLFLGHAESGILNRDDFISAKYPSSFAFSRKSHPGKQHTGRSSGKAQAAAMPEHASAPEPKPAAKAPHKSRSGFSESTATRTEGPDRGKILREAAEMADKGDLKEAEELCLSYLQQDKLNPFAYYVLGVIGLSAGRLDDAEKAFNKAIYLDPGYYEALVHLALIKERQGDRDRASIIRKRAEKAAVPAR